MSWKVWKWNGRYIQGELVSSHTSEAAALKKAKKVIKHHRTERKEEKDEITIWLDAEDGTPLGVITKKINKKSKGAKRIRQGKKKE